MFMKQLCLPDDDKNALSCMHADRNSHAHEHMLPCMPGASRPPDRLKGGRLVDMHACWWTCRLGDAARGPNGLSHPPRQPTQKRFERGELLQRKTCERTEHWDLAATLTHAHMLDGCNSGTCSHACYAHAGRNR